MHPVHDFCPGCGAPISVGSAIEGFCARCVAGAAFRMWDTDEEEFAPGKAAPLGRLGDYDLLEEIGRGGTGVVYRARQSTLGRDVALKVVALGPWAAPDQRLRFRREATATAALRHPNLVTVYEAGEADGHAFLSMEWIEGKTLADLVRDGPLHPERAARYGRAIAEAVAAAHARGILHRDLKPANVLIDPADQPRVADFGLAKALQSAEFPETPEPSPPPPHRVPGNLSRSATTSPDNVPKTDMGAGNLSDSARSETDRGSANSSCPGQGIPRAGTSSKRERSAPGDLDALGRTRTGQIMGSPGYMPPEQADPTRGELTFGSDVYAIGAVLYHLLTGRPPFAGSTVTATLTQVLNDDPAPPRRLNSNVPRDLETICLKCLQKESSRRYATAADMASDLEAFLEQRPIRARPVSLAEKALLWCRRRPALAALILAVHGVAAIGLAGILWQGALNRNNLYAADLRLASQAVQDGDLGHARDLLQRHAPSSGSGDLAWRLLRDRGAGDPREIIGEHPWIVSSIAWSPDGKRIASGSVGSGTIGEDLRVWDVTRRPAGTSILATNGVRDLAWFPDSRRLMAVRTLGGVQIFDTEENQTVSTYPGMSAALSRDGQYLVTCEGVSVLWEEHGRTGPVVLRNLIQNTEQIFGEARAATISSDGRWIAATDLFRTVTLFEATTSASPRELRVSSALWGLTFSPDSRWLVGTGTGTNVQVWDLQTTNAAPRLLAGHAKDTWRAAFSPDGTRLATASSDQSIRVWSTATWEPLGNLRGHGSEVWCVAFSPDGNQLASGGKDRTVAIWPLTFDRLPDVITGAVYGPCHFSPDGRLIASVSSEDYWTTIITDTRQADSVRTVRGLRPLGFDRTADILFGSESGHRIARINIAKDIQILHEWTLDHEPGEETPVKWSLSANHARLAGMGNGGISVWDFRSGRRLGRFKLQIHDTWFVHLGPDGEWLAITAGEEGFWVGRATATSLKQITSHRDMAKWASFSPDGKLLATASVDATLKLWRLPGLTEVATLRGHPTEVSAVAFAPDGEILASVEEAQGLRLWHLPTLREVAVIPMSRTGPGVIFSDDGQSLAVSLRNGTWRILRAPRGQKADF